MKNDDLRTKYPTLYDQLSHFECGDGWYQILDNLSKEIMDIIISDPNHESVKVVQVKEKFGGLRYYINGGSQKIYKVINKAEALCDETCEDCGQPGESRSGGWIRTLCDACDKGRK